jgi:hypothetical protein
MATLIPLKHIPYKARKIEASERRKHSSRKNALESATIEIVLAPGCYSGAYPPTVGWVLTKTAADEMSKRMTTMPGGSAHRRINYVIHNS